MFLITFITLLETVKKYQMYAQFSIQNYNAKYIELTLKKTKTIKILAFWNQKIVRNARDVILVRFGEQRTIDARRKFPIAMFRLSENLRNQPLNENP